MPSVPSLHIIFASTSGHTEYVVGALAEHMRTKVPGLTVELQRAEQAKPEDLLLGDVLILASGSWNTGGIEGQLNPHMHEFLVTRCAEMKLGGRKALLIALGDERYRYLCNSGHHLRMFLMQHGGEQAGHLLKIVNEPYGQETKVREWADAEVLPLFA